MTYDKQTWVNAPSTASPISASRLNHVEDGIEVADAVAAEALSTAQAASVLPTSIPTATNLLWDDVKVSLARGTVGLNNPSLATFRNGVQAYSFNESVMQQLFFDIQLPHTWAEGTDIHPHIHWSPGNGNDTTNVRWGLEYTWANSGGTGNTFPATTIVYATQAASGVPYSVEIASFGAISGVGKRVSSLLMCRVFRDATNVGDTYGQGAFGLSLDFHVQCNGGGTVIEYPV